jgi:hypothetical protein
MSCCDFKVPDIANMKCPQITSSKQYKALVIEDNRVYFDGKFYGYILEIIGNEMKVICKNGNKYMEGQIMTINFKNTE